VRAGGKEWARSPPAKKRWKKGLDKSGFRQYTAHNQSFDYVKTDDWEK
jgi:hypothetical protein